MREQIIRKDASSQKYAGPALEEKKADAPDQGKVLQQGDNNIR